MSRATGKHRCVCASRKRSQRACDWNGWCNDCSTRVGAGLVLYCYSFRFRPCLPPWREACYRLAHVSTVDRPAPCGWEEDGPVSWPETSYAPFECWKGRLCCREFILFDSATRQTKHNSTAATCTPLGLITFTCPHIHACITHRGGAYAHVSLSLNLIL